MGIFDRKQIRKFNGKKYVYDRMTRSGKKGKKTLENIARAGVKNKAIKGYRIVKGKKNTYYLYIRP